MAYAFTFTPRFQKHFKNLTVQEKKQLKNWVAYPHLNRDFCLSANNRNLIRQKTKSL